MHGFFVAVRRWTTGTKPGGPDEARIMRSARDAALAEWQRAADDCSASLAPLRWGGQATV